MPSLFTLLLLLALTALNESLGLYAATAVVFWKLLRFALGASRHRERAEP